MDKDIKSKTKKGVYWSFFNQFANYGMQFCVGIVMARLLSPSDYGITALPAVLMAVAGTFTEAGFISALIRKPDCNEYDLSTSFYYSLVVGVVMYLLLYFTAPLFASFYNVPVLVPLVRVTALSFFWGPLNTAQSVILNRRLDFKTPAKISVYTKAISAVVGILLAICGMGLWALVISGLLSTVLGLLFSWYFVRWIPKTGWSKESFKYLWNYGNKMMISRLLDTLYNNITPLFIGKYYSPAQLGVYNRAYNYATLPSKNVTAVLAGVTFPVLSKMQDDNEKLANNYRRMLKVSAFVIFPAMLMLSALAHPLVITMVTSKWESCVILLQIICFSMMWYPIHAINVNLLQVKGRSDLFLRVEVLKKITGLLILVVTLPMGLVVFCYGNILSSMISLVINTYYTGKLIHVGYWKQMKDLLPIFTLSFLMWLAIHAVNYFISNMIFQIIVGGMVGFVLYVGIAYMMKFSELEDVKYMLNRKK